MTLTAVTASEDLFNPSVMIDRGVKREDVVRMMRSHQKVGLFCPHCLGKTGEMVPVIFRNTESKRVHFFHPQNEAEGRECSKYQGESEKHLAAKAAIQRQLQIDGLSEVKLEVLLKYTPGLPWRKPDILVTHLSGGQEAHEIQISYISAAELLERTNDLKAHKADRVVWYLYGKNFNQENRQICHSNNIECYHLWFENQDIGAPRWKKDEGFAIAARQGQGSGPDACSRKPFKQVPQPQFKPKVQSPVFPEGKRIVAHKSKPGWVGYVYETPWGMDGICEDVMWVQSPADPTTEKPYPLPIYPQRYSTQDLVDYVAAPQEAIAIVQSREVAA